MTTGNPTCDDDTSSIERKGAVETFFEALSTGERGDSASGSERFLLAIGGLNLAFAAGRGYLGATGVIAGREAAIDVFVVGGLGLLLIYYASRLPQTGIHPETYSRIVARSLAGVAILLTVLALVDLNPAGTIDEPIQVVGIALSLGSVGGYAVGVNEARALTRAREAEQHERELQRQNEHLERFASMLTHELRNPLNIAQIYLSQADPRDAEAADEIESALDRIEEMIDVVLVMARTTDSEIERETVSLAEAAADAWDDVPAESISVVAESDRSIRADPIHLHHLLVNLFRNAAKHGGEDVTVTVGSLPTGFYVEDDGTGIPAAERDAVFDAGHTTHPDGIGLGLAFVDRLVETYGWDCAITESETGGARFEFTGVDLVSDDY